MKYLTCLKNCIIEFSFLFFIFTSTPITIYSQTIDELIKQVDSYYQIDDFEKAISFSEKALIKAEKDFGNESIEYAIALDRRARLYSIYDETMKAEKLYLESLEIIENKKGTNTLDYTTVLLDLANLNSSPDNYDSAEKQYLKVLEIRKKLVTENNPSYMEALERTAYFYFDYYDYVKAEQIYKEAYRIIKNLGLENSGNYLLFLSNFAVMYEEQKKYHEAIPIVKDVLKITETTNGKEHQNYINLLIELIDLYIKTGLYENTEPIISEAIEININELTDYFVYLPEEGKKIILESIYDYSDLYYSVGYKQKSVNKNLLAEIFNFRLATKGLVLSSTMGLRNKISKLNDNYLFDDFNYFLKLKSDLAFCNTLTPEEQKQKGFNKQKLEKAVDSVEYRINIRYTDLKKERKESLLKFEDIKKSLGPDEAAIDYVNFVYSEQDNIDSIYCAFLILPESEYPEFIKLCTYSELNNIIGDDNDYFKNPDKLTALYKLVFSPLENLFGVKKNIYISPSGILNKISFASLQRDDKSYLADKYKISYLMNPSEILSKKESQGKNSVVNAAIFGGINYSLDSTAFLDASKNTRRDLTGSEFENMDLSGYLKNNLSRGRGIPYLKGTLDESESINNIMNSNGIVTLYYTGNNGTEEAFKSLTGNNSPSVIHIATHGFYFPESENINKNLSDARQTKSIRGNYKINSNPLVRSGLIFAGADFIWNEGKRFQGTEDGILTALEVTCMDLENTELVVLSACETGLGDIKNGEGVYGLNRAFKIAGAKNIILSLWQVPDKETGELMNYFYKFLIQEKMTIEDAFFNAQKEIKQKYNEPFYWSAFVLI